MSFKALLKEIIQSPDVKTLLLDRDGVINVRFPDKYISSKESFQLVDGIIGALPVFKSVFDYIFVVTNQQGIGKGLMTEHDLHVIHKYFLDQIENSVQHFIDRIYFCPHKKEVDCPCRKPKDGMAVQIKKDFPNVNFKNSVMVGDSQSDMEFGRNIGSKTILISSKKDEVWTKRKDLFVDFESSTLYEIAEFIRQL